MTLSGTGAITTGEAAAPHSLTLRLVLCLAGDIERAEDEAATLNAMTSADPEALYAECLRLLVGRRSVAEFAEQEWNTLLAHRRDLEEKLERPVALQTAALDFFCDARPKAPEMMLVPAEVFDNLRSEARIDATTGLFTPNTFAWALEHEVQRARRYRRHIVLLLIEIDDMDVLKSRRGAEYSDFVLREVADLVNGGIRNTDTAARVDEETFAVLLHECKLQDGSNLAERMRATVETQSFSPHEGDEGAHLTVSIAVVGYPESGDGGDKLMGKARQLITKARDLGKNRVETAEFPR